MKNEELYTLEQVQNMCFWTVKFINENLKRGKTSVNKAVINQFVEDRIDELKDEQ